MPKLQDLMEKSYSKIVVIGQHGTGKTTLASTIGGNQYWFCFETGLKSLLGKSELYNDLEYDNYLCAYEKKDTGKSWTAACAKLTELSKDLKGVDTIVVDSVSSMTEVILEDIQKELGNWGKAPSFGLKDFYTPWTNLSIACKAFTNGLLRLDCNVVMIAHEIKQEDEEGRMYWSLMAEGSKFPAWLPKQVDEVWRMTTKTDKDVTKHILTTQGGRGFKAKSRMAAVGKFSAEEEPNISKLINRFNENLKKL